MSAIVRRLGALERAGAPKRQLIAVGDKAEAEHVKRDREARGETGSALIVITGVPRSEDEIEVQ